MSRVVITLDYKQNIKLNIGPEEESRRFYHQAHRTVLGFLCQYKDRATGRLVNHYVDYISPCLTHDAAFALECLQDLVATFLLPRGLDQLDVWSDCGAHFRCYEVLAGVCVQLPLACRSLNVPLLANLHYFVEKHGKSAVDGHFSLLSRWLQQAAAQHDIVSTADLERALVQQSTAHLQATRSPPDLPNHRCDFRFYTPFCQEHSGSYHESLCSDDLESGHVDTSQAVLDDDGDVQMSEAQWASQPSDSSFTSIASSSPSFSPIPSYDSMSFDEAAADDVAAVAAAAAAAPVGKEERVPVSADVPVLSLIGEESAERGSSGAAADVPAAMHNRVEGRVKCTRRAGRRRPSIEMPSSSPIKLTTHYDWTCSTLPKVTPPPSAPSAASSSSSSSSFSSFSAPSTPSSSSSSPFRSSSCSSFSYPLSSSSSPSFSSRTAVLKKQVATEDISAAIAALPSSCPVTLSAAVLSDSAVWPRQSVRTVFQSEPCTIKEYISFAPRLQEMPNVVAHPTTHAAVQTRLQSAHLEFSRLSAIEACDMAAAFCVSPHAHAD